MEKKKKRKTIEAQYLWTQCSVCLSPSLPLNAEMCCIFSKNLVHAGSVYTAKLNCAKGPGNDNSFIYGAKLV